MEKELAKFLSRLTSLKNNLPKSLSTEEKYVREYHDILGGLEKNSGENLSEFKVPDSDAYRDSDSGERFYDRHFLSMKIDAVLGYFTILLQPVEIKNELGFRVQGRD